MACPIEFRKWGDVRRAARRCQRTSVRRLIQVAIDIVKSYLFNRSWLTQ